MCVSALCCLVLLCILDTISLLKALFVELCVFLVREGGIEDAHVNEVKRLLPGPLFEDIIYFQYTIRRGPCDRRREEIDSADGG